MRDPEKPSVILLRYFFRRFFENDLIDAAGETVTTVVRALSTVAAPGLMVAFFLQNQYPRRSAWGRVEDHYFFVLYSFVVMAGIALFKWEMLFPDRLDFLVLSHLPLRQLHLLAAKAGALLSFLALFLFAANVFGWWTLPAVSRESFGRHLLAHAVAVLGAGCFGALAVLCIGGVLLCLLPQTLFRFLSPILRTGGFAALGLLLIHYVRFGDHLDAVLSAPLGAARLVPTFWFLGVYEQLLRGAAAQPFAQPMTCIAVLATGAAFAIAALVYPLAWVRMRRMTVEGAPSARWRTLRTFAAPLRLLDARAPLRAMLPFIGKTLARNARYQAYLSLYFGAGLALAAACALTFTHQEHSLRAALSPRGLYAVVPLLIFWTIAGLRLAFALPILLPARWIFRLSGASRSACVDAARAWATACSLVLLAALLLLLCCAGLSHRALLVQAACGICLCVVIADGLLFADSGIPFAQPRASGKTSLPLTLVLFLGVLPLACLGMVHLELWLESHLLYLLLCVAIMPAIHAGSGVLRSRFQAEPEDGSEFEPEFQILGLSAD